MWRTITIEGTDEFGAAHRSEITLEKDLNSFTAGAVGFSIEDGKTIMAHLQQVIVKQQCETYVLVRRFCMDCERFRRIKDYSKRKIRTVFSCVEVRNPRILNCQRCVPYFRDASAVLRDFCPDQATPELMELSARLGSLMPYRKAADVIAEFLPVKSTESFARFAIARSLSASGSMKRREIAPGSIRHTLTSASISSLIFQMIPSESSLSALTQPISKALPRRTGKPLRSQLRDASADYAAPVPVTIS
jgi:hypothetical protein